MSDDCDVCHNAWTQVMGEATHRLLCSCHVDRAWHKNTQVNKSSFLKSDVSKSFNYKVMKKNLETYWMAFQINKKQKILHEFGVYLRNYYTGEAPM